MENQLLPLGLDDTFHFGCTPQVPCFNQCCRDLNQFLTPYDILRLKRGLGLSSGRFLETYTRCNTGPQTGLPVVTLKAGPAPERQCPFVSAAGCTVYADRPSSCRTYPLVRLAVRSRQTGQTSARYALLQEPHCRGFDQPRNQSVAQWLASQEVVVYNEVNDLFLELIALKNRFQDGPLGLREAFLFSLALYDLDRFREQLYRQGLLDRRDFSADELAAAERDDLALLKLGHRWVRQTLFQPTRG